MFPDWKDAGFVVEVADGRFQAAARDGPEGGVLDGLELRVGGVADEWRPDWSNVVEDGPACGFVGHRQRLFVLAPRCPCEGLQCVVALGDPGCCPPRGT